MDWVGWMSVMIRRCFEHDRNVYDCFHHIGHLGRVPRRNLQLDGVTSSFEDGTIYTSGIGEQVPTSQRRTGLRRHEQRCITFYPMEVITQSPHPNAAGPHHSITSNGPLTNTILQQIPSQLLRMTIINPNIHQRNSLKCQRLLHNPLQLPSLMHSESLRPKRLSKLDEIHSS